MIHRLLALAGAAVKSINPSLLRLPPPATEESGHDVCYLGPNGEDDHDHVTYCKDLPEGKREMVGSWYIHPERHFCEFLIFVTITSIIIRRLLPTLPKYPEQKAVNLNPPLFMKIATFFIFTIQVVYKAKGYPGKILFMAMPCNVLWTMWAALCFLPMRTQTRHIMYQLIIPYTSLSVVAVAVPDTSGLEMWMEVPFFFFIHYALIAYPIYFLQTGRISVLSPNGMVSDFTKWWTLACSFFGLFYFGVADPLALVFGINLNYMLSPPPNPGDMVSGPNFRLQSSLCCALAFFLVQFLVTLVAVILKAMSKSSFSARKKSL